MIDLEVIILAAGKGTRMQSSLPKVLHPIGGKSMVEHVLSTSKKFDAKKAIHLVTGHGADKLEAALSHLEPPPFYIKQNQQLGTGHAVQQVLPSLGDNSVSLILYGDVPLIRTATLEKLIAKLNDNTLALLTVDLENPQGYGRIIRDDQQQIQAIVEQKDANAHQLKVKEVNTGIMAVHSRHLRQWLPALSNHNAQGEYYLTDIIAMAVADGVQVLNEQPDDEWEVVGVNNRQQQAELERIYQYQQALDQMSRGVTLLDPHRFDCRGHLNCGKDVLIDVNCVFEGENTLGDGVTIGPNCIIKNAVIGNGSEIKANSVIEDTQVGDECTIGPFARLRPGTQLSSQVKIGNFVETKKALIAQGSKVNHLSYVGDARLGQGVNIGAGTITCNYDGVNKYETVIEDDVFVGSNTALVAPVTLGQGSTVGAGSTISKSVDQDTLALTRSTQKNLKDWQRPTKKS